MNTIKLLDYQDPNWVTFVHSQSGAGVFHEPTWIGVLTRCYGYDSLVLALQDESGTILAGTPIMKVNSRLTGKRWISLPFSDYCNPLALSDIHLAEWLDGIAVYHKEINTPPIEIRWEIPEHSSFYSVPNYVFHTVQLEPDPVDVFSTFSKKCRQYSHKAERQGLTLSVANDFRGVEIFYGLHLLVRQKLGVPIQPKRFFRLLWEEVISKGYGSILIISYNGKPISGAVMLGCNKKAMIKYSATNPAYLELRAHYYTFWKCIEWACLNCYELIDFGRTDISDEGLRFFKNGWGSQEQILHYSMLADRLPAEHSANSLHQRVMTTVIQHSPAWVCRLTGELLYGHFA
jgi:CelD/BcsL family acetyltransferase involved in cellulose biosynthesis